jgi:chromosome partitioning protein
MGKLGRRGPTYAPLRDILADRLAPAARFFKWIVLDCPPKLDILKPAVYRYADWVIVPTRADYLSVSGSVAHTKDLAQMIEEDPKVKARILKVLPTMVSPRQVADRQMRTALANAYGQGRIGTPIPVSVKVKEAPGRGLTVEEYAPGSAPAVAYGRLVEDVIKYG